MLLKIINDVIVFFLAEDGYWQTLTSIEINEKEDNVCHCMIKYIEKFNSYHIML